MSTNARRQTAPAARAAVDFHAMPGARHFRPADLASWQDAQRRYRHLVQTRHPDRLGRGANEATHAEFIEIAAAFKRLRERYRRDGSLPLAYPPVPAGGATPARPVRTRPAPAAPAPAPPRAAPPVPFPDSPLGPARRRTAAARAARDERRARRRAALVYGTLATLALGLVVGLGAALDARLERANRDAERSLETGR